MTKTSKTSRTSRTMKALILGAWVVGLSLALAAGAAHHLNGSWTFAVTLDGQGGSATITLEEGAGGVLTGKYAGALGEAPVTGKVDGAKVEIAVESQAGKITYAGEYQDGVIKGTCDYGELGKGTFEATKKP